MIFICSAVVRPCCTFLNRFDFYNNLSLFSDIVKTDVEHSIVPYKEYVIF